MERIRKKNPERLFELYSKAANMVTEPCSDKFGFLTNLIRKGNWHPQSKDFDAAYEFGISKTAANQGDLAA